MSADATLAWGVNLNVGEYGDMEEGVAEKVRDLDDNDYGLEELFGFNEEYPTYPERTRGFSKAECEADPDYQAWRAAGRAYRERKLAAIPVEFGQYGTYDNGGRVLFVKRTYTSINWGIGTVDPLTLMYPSSAELAALNKVLDAIGFKGDRTPQLLLSAMYG